MTAYEVRISDWRSDVCSADLIEMLDHLVNLAEGRDALATDLTKRIGESAHQADRRFGKVADVGAGRRAVVLRQDAGDRLLLNPRVAIHFRERRAKQIGRAHV